MKKENKQKKKPTYGGARSTVEDKIHMAEPNKYLQKKRQPKEDH